MTVLELGTNSCKMQWVIWLCNTNLPVGGRWASKITCQLCLRWSSVIYIWHVIIFLYFQRAQDSKHYIILYDPCIAFSRKLRWEMMTEPENQRFIAKSLKFQIQHHPCIWKTSSSDVRLWDQILSYFSSLHQIWKLLAKNRPSYKAGLVVSTPWLARREDLCFSCFFD